MSLCWFIAMTIPGKAGDFCGLSRRIKWGRQSLLIANDQFTTDILPNMRSFLSLWALLWAMIGSAGAVQMPAELVNTWYSFDQAGPFSSLDIFLKWENDPAITRNVGVYAGFGFWFQNGVVGYFGTQVDSQGKKAIFSIWDTGTATFTARPIGKCMRFGEEGTGAQCIIPYRWIAGHEYRLKLSHGDRVDSAEQWQTTILDVATGVETVIGVIALGDSRTYSGYGQINPQARFVNWLEHYGYGNLSCDTLPYAKVTWRGPYANNEQFTASHATAAFLTPDCLNKNISTTGAPGVTQESGGATVRSSGLVSDSSLWPTVLNQNNKRRKSH